MPNHVTTILNAPKEVIESAINSEGHFDFCKIIPRHEDLSLNGASGIPGDSEMAADVACGEPLNSNPLIASLEAHNRSKVDALKMSEESFELFIMMVRNKRKHGFYHMMDYARSAWSTKWNAYDIERNSDDEIKFETAWSHPFPVIEALSKKFPESEIAIRYADEDTGSNCGTYTIKNGEAVAKDIAPSYSEQTADEKRKWTEFAFRLKNPDSDPREYGYNESWEYDEDVEAAFYESQKQS